jgi:hypothetical protein
MNDAEQHIILSCMFLPQHILTSSATYHIGTGLFIYKDIKSGVTTGVKFINFRAYEQVVSTCNVSFIL